MSVILLATVKGYLRVTHALDDALLQELLDAAEDEILRFCNRSELPGMPYTLPEESSSEPNVSSEASVAPSIVTAVCCIVKADYEAADADEAMKLRQVAEAKAMPYRTEMGV